MVAFAVEDNFTNKSASLIEKKVYSSATFKTNENPINNRLRHSRSCEDGKRKEFSMLRESARTSESLTRDELIEEKTIENFKLRKFLSRAGKALDVISKTAKIAAEGLNVMGKQNIAEGY